MKWNINKMLGVFSILGFIGIIVRASSSYDITVWVEIFLFSIMGMILFGAGGYKLFFKYFDNGLTWDEATSIVIVSIGAVSMLIALLMLPMLNLTWADWGFFSGFKIVISLIAIFTIALEMFTGGVCK